MLNSTGYPSLSGSAEPPVQTGHKTIYLSVGSVRVIAQNERGYSGDFLPFYEVDANLALN